MKRLFYLISLSLITFGCTNSEKPIIPPTIIIPQLSSIAGSSIKISATDESQLVESVLIFTDDNNPIPDGTQFKIVAETVKINSVESSSLNDWKSEIFVSSNEGKFSFYVKPHTVAGLYRVNAYPVENGSVQFDSGMNARYFINVVAGPPVNLGLIKTDFFQDLANYNGIKDSNESWIVTSNPDFISYVAVGPIMDIHGNLVEEGSIQFSVDQGNILSENPTKILAGYSYFSYKSDGSVGNVISNASVINHPKNTLLLKSETFKKASPQISLSRSPDFSGMTVGQSKCESISVFNNGAMASTNLDFSSSFPFLVIDENQSDSLCPITPDVCKLRQTLRSGESCILRTKLTMPSTSLSDGDLIIQVDPQEFSSSLLIQKLRTQSVQAAQLISSNPFISFGGTQCSTSRVVDIYVQNIGDFDATGIVVQNPPPNTNQSNPFFSIILPPQDIVMNPNLNSIVNCGTTFPSGRKCRVQIQFNPTAGIVNQALLGRILGDNINPLILSMSGYTIPGNALNSFPISFITPNNSLLPLGMFIGNVQQSRVEIGPIVDACNQRVADGSIISASVTGGILLQQTLVSNNGFASFLWNSGTDISKLGNQSINIFVGVNGSKSGSLLFRGVDLVLSGNSDFGQVIDGKQKELTVTLTNNGNILAQNLSISANSPLVVVDKGSCSSNQLAPQSSCQIIVRADPQGINQDLTIPVIASSSSLGSSNTFLNFTLSARTKPVLSFDKSDYLFNDGTLKSIYTQNITLKNEGPAISYDTVSLIEAPFFIQSTNCTTTLLVNQTCSITVGLNSSDVSLGANKKLSMSNEVTLESPIANLGFSRLQINQPPLLGIRNRCFGPYNVSISGNTGVISSTSSQNINLGSFSNNIIFYSNSSCLSGTEITSEQISSGSSISSNFYLKNPLVVSDSIVVSHSTISSGFLSAQFNEELNLNVPIPNALINDEILSLIPSGGYEPFTIEIVGGSSPYAELINELDENLDPTGNKILKVLSITGSQNVNLKVTDSLGYVKDITFNLYQPLSTLGSITIQNNNSNLIPFNSYGNPNNLSFKLQNFSGSSYIDGSLFGSTINSSGFYIVGSSVSSGTEYVLIEIPKATGGSTSVRVSVIINLQWPFGTLGDLVINSGQTVNLNAGQSYDYQSITINSGGTLNITGKGIILLGSVNNFIINGNITSDTFDDCSSNFSLTDPDINSSSPLLVSYVYSSAGTGGNGGNGPGGHHWSGGASGGAGCCGYGGGGGGGGGGAWSGGCCGMHYNGGTGGSCGNAGGYSYGSGNVYQFGYYGGSGMITYGHGGHASGGSVGGGSGGGAGAKGVFNNALFANHSGGGGGMKGFHKNSLFIRTKSSVIGSGTINLAGTNGFNGGFGGSPTICDFYQPGSGGGGGGGDGGSGGTVNIKYKIANSFPLSNINTNGGVRGSGGSQGYSCYSSSAHGSRGFDGSNGANGLISISLY